MSHPVLSIGIKCHRDIRIFKTLSSIDIPNVDIIVALTPYPALEKRLLALNCRVVTVIEGSHGISSQACIDNALCDKIVITDSDSSFGPGYLQRMLELLEFYDVARGKFIETHNPWVIGSKLVSNFREYVHNIEKHMYMPGLAINRKIANNIGGSIFNTSLARGVDYEFAVRIKANNISTYLERSVFIIHEPENILHDLVAAWITGSSTHHLDTLNPLEDRKWFTPFRSLLTIMGFGHIQQYWTIAKTSGLYTAAYYHAWTVLFLIGYNCDKLKTQLSRLKSKDKREWRKL